MSAKALINTSLFTGVLVCEGSWTWPETSTWWVSSTRGFLSQVRQADHENRHQVLCRHAPGLVSIQVNGGGGVRSGVWGVLCKDSPSVDALRMVDAAHKRLGTTGFLVPQISDGEEEMRATIAAGWGASEFPACWDCIMVNPTQSRILRCPRPRQVAGTGRAHFRAVGFTRGRRSDTGNCGTGDGCSEDRTNLHSRQNGVRRTLPGGSGAIPHGGRCRTERLQPSVQSDVPTGRASGLLGTVPDPDKTLCSVIVDGHHDHPAPLRMALTAKRHGGVILIGDGMPSVGSPYVDFRPVGERVEACGFAPRNQRCCLAGSNFAHNQGGTTWKLPVSAGQR